MLRQGGSQIKQQLLEQQIQEQLASQGQHISTSTDTLALDDRLADAAVPQQPTKLKDSAEVLSTPVPVSSMTTGAKPGLVPSPPPPPPPLVQTKQSPQRAFKTPPAPPPPPAKMGGMFVTPAPLKAVSKTAPPPPPPPLPSAAGVSSLACPILYLYRPAGIASVACSALSRPAGITPLACPALHRPAVLNPT